MPLKRAADRNEPGEQVLGLPGRPCEKKRDGIVDFVQGAAAARPGSQFAEVPSQTGEDPVDGHGDIPGNMATSRLEQHDVEADAQGRHRAAHESPLVWL